MVKCDVRLLNADGSLRMMISRGEAVRLFREKKVTKFRGHRGIIYRLKDYPAPSAAKESPCMLTRADLEAVTGIRQMNAIRRERLIGWGLLKERISDFAHGVRAVHDPDQEYRGDPSMLKFETQAAVQA